MLNCLECSNYLTLGEKERRECDLCGYSWPRKRKKKRVAKKAGQPATIDEARARNILAAENLLNLKNFLQ
jgi:DNA-directed RNA polymerase subunit M/transcription elongation factor TFIIS